MIERDRVNNAEIITRRGQQENTALPMQGVGHTSSAQMT